MSLRRLKEENGVRLRPETECRIRIQIQIQNSTRTREEEMANFDPEKIAVYRLARQHTRAVRALLATAATRGLQNQIAALLITMLRNLEAEQQRRRKARAGERTVSNGAGGRPKVPEL
jgi:hypothetical protein